MVGRPKKETTTKKKKQSMGNKYVGVDQKKKKRMKWLTYATSTYDLDKLVPLSHQALLLGSEAAIFARQRLS